MSKTWNKSTANHYMEVYYGIYSTTYYNLCFQKGDVHVKELAGHYH